MELPRAGAGSFCRAWLPRLGAGALRRSVVGSAARARLRGVRPTGGGERDEPLDGLGAVRTVRAAVPATVSRREHHVHDKAEHLRKHGRTAAGHTLSSCDDGAGLRIPEAWPCIGGGQGAVPAGVSPGAPGVVPQQRRRVDVPAQRFGGGGPCGAAAGRGRGLGELCPDGRAGGAGRDFSTRGAYADGQGRTRVC